MINPVDILRFIHSKKYSPMTAAELAEHFEISDAEYRQFCNLLQELEFSGEIVKIKQKQYADPEKVHLLVGAWNAIRGDLASLSRSKKAAGKTFMSAKKTWVPPCTETSWLSDFPQKSRSLENGKKRGEAHQDKSLT